MEFVFLKVLILLEKKLSRGSNFRGVSKNGPNWQVLFMAHGKREYLGGIKTEIEAARYYDMVSLRAHGYHVRL